MIPDVYFQIKKWSIIITSFFIMSSVRWTQAVLRAIKKTVTFVDASISTGQGFVQIKLKGDRIDDLHAFIAALPRCSLSLVSDNDGTLAPIAAMLIITEGGPINLWHRRSEFYIMFISLFLSLLVKYSETVYAYVYMLMYGQNSTST